MHRLYVVSFICACQLLTGCAVQQSVPPASTAPISALSLTRQVRPASAVRPSSTSPVWGTGLDALAELYAGGSSYQRAFCQTPGNNYPSCPMYAYAKRTYGYTVSKSLHDPNFGTYSLVQSGSSALGAQVYSQTENAAGNSISNGMFSIGVANFNWIDVITIKSATLKKGSPVTLGVVLALNPVTTGVGCDQYGQSSASLIFDGSGTDGQGSSALEVEGSCENGSFVYRLGAPITGPIGTSDPGVLTGYVGQPLTIVGGGQVYSQACGGGSYCDGTYATTIAGSVKWSITSITPGATFKSRAEYVSIEAPSAYAFWVGSPSFYARAAMLRSIER